MSAGVEESYLPSKDMEIVSTSIKHFLMVGKGRPVRALVSIVSKYMKPREAEILAVELMAGLQKTRVT